MPTFLGPTNLPPLEALEYGIPSICSDLRGHREMLGDSALYFDPSSSVELAQALVLMSQPAIRKELKDKMEAVKESSVFNYTSARNALQDLFTHLQKRVRS